MGESISHAESIDYRKKIDQLGLVQPTGWAFLPANLESANDRSELIHCDSVMTLRKVMRAEGLVETPVEPPGTRLPREALRYINWMGPTIFFSAAVIVENPHVVNICLNVISNYVYELFQGRTSEVKACLRIAIEAKKGAPAKIVKYDGPVEGLKEIAKIIKSLDE